MALVKLKVSWSIVVRFADSLNAIATGGSEAVREIQFLRDLCDG